jgi:hypothetical protein
MKFAALSITMLSLSAITLSASTVSLLDPKDAAAITQDSVKTYGHMSGTIISVVSLDSEAWVIQGKDGRIYDPVNLPDSLRSAGTQINFSYKPASNWGYTYASGELIELTQVSRAR